MTIDLLVTWDWEYDAEFIRYFESAARESGLNAVFVGPHNLEEYSKIIDAQKPRIKMLLDRASDTSAAFDRLIDKIVISGAKTINEASNSIRAIDKATMHLEFLTKGLDVPRTIILSAADDVNGIKRKNLKNLGSPFIIKPSRGGGGYGVIMTAETLDDIIAAQEHCVDDKYLLQEKVIPKILAGRRAWFRVFYVCGKVFPCWWDDQTHLFGMIDKKESFKTLVKRLEDITKSIAQVCRLDFFSTEICVTENNRYVVVDYVNDPCDMRPQSTHPDGVPDKIIRDIIDRIIKFVQTAQIEPVTSAKKELLIRRRDFELALLRRHR